MFLTPIIFTIAVYLVLKMRLSLPISILTISLIFIVEDLFIKHNSGGTYDIKGAGLINFIFLVSLVIATIEAFLLLKFQQKYKVGQSLFSSLLILIIGVAHIYYFGFYGLEYSESASESLAESKERGVFVNNLEFSDNEINYKNYNIKFKDGWVEKVEVINHKNSLKEKYYSEKLNFIIRTSQNLEKHQTSVYYKINSNDVNGATPVDTILKFSLPKTVNDRNLTFFETRNPRSEDTIFHLVRIDY